MSETSNGRRQPAPRLSPEVLEAMRANPAGPRGGPLPEGEDETEPEE